MNYEKYLKYKNKYLELKNQIGGNDIIVESFSGSNSFYYYKITDKESPYNNKKILLYGFIHLYDRRCLDCDEHNNCYPISSYIEKVAETKCIDVFQEVNIIYK